MRKRTSIRAATRAFPQKGLPLPDAGTPKSKLQYKYIFAEDFNYRFSFNFSSTSNIIAGLTIL
jgi:hypothetical protein